METYVRVQSVKDSNIRVSYYKLGPDVKLLDLELCLRSQGHRILDTKKLQEKDLTNKQLEKVKHAINVPTYTTKVFTTNQLDNFIEGKKNLNMKKTKN